MKAKKLNDPVLKLRRERIITFTEMKKVKNSLPIDSCGGCITPIAATKCGI